MFDLDILINGKSVSKYPHEGRVYVEGRRGSEYSLKFTNRSSRRVIAVFSVDGLSVMDGNTARFDDAGYVVEAFSSITIPGWRLDNEAIAKFKFGDRKTSYAEKKGAGGNVGVIGCVVFNELQVPHHWFKYNRDECDYGPDLSGSKGIRSPMADSGFDVTWDTNSSGHTYNASCTNASCTGEERTSGSILRSCSVTPAAAPQLGTEFGRRDSHRVQEIMLSRESTPTTIIEIHYDTRKSLEAMGIVVGAKVVKVSKAFPNESYGIGCTPPSGWRGKP